MPNALPDKVRQLLEKPVLAHLATVMKDGSPQVTPLWVDTDGEYVLVNTSEGRLKTKNMRRNPHVAISVVDPANPFMGTLQVRGTVVDITAQGADEHINKLSHKYTGSSYRGPRSGRLIVRIRPEKLSGGVMRG